MSLDAIIFPDRELIQIDGERVNRTLKMALSPFVPPQALFQDINNFIIVNWVMRPPLTDEEIRMMPVEEVIGTYYSINRYTSKCEFKKNPVISAGLPDILAKVHEANIQQRIFTLRADLRTVTYQNKTYRVLLDPNLLKEPDCGPGTVFNIGVAVLSLVFSLGAGGIGVIAVLALNAAQAAQTVYTQVETAKANVKAAGIAGELSTGFQLAKALTPSPVPSAGLVAALKQKYADWQRTIAWASSNSMAINAKWIHLWDAAIVMTAIGNTTSYMPYTFDGAAYMAKWQPFPKFFWSDAVANMVFHPEQISRAITVTSTTEKQAATAAAIGAGLLLLLL